MADNWEDLSNYESVDLIKAEYKRKYGRSWNTQLARGVASSITQGRHYFEAAQAADRSVRPLLLYYGVLSVSRGLIQFLAGKREEHLSQAHGLTVVDWSTNLSDVANLKIVADRAGTFSELIEATRNSNILPSGGGIGTNTFALKPIGRGLELSLEDLLVRLPEVTSTVSRWATPKHFTADAVATPGALWPPAKPNEIIELRIHDRDASLTAEAIHEIIGPGKIASLDGDKVCLLKTAGDFDCSMTYSRGPLVGFVSFTAAYAGGVQLNKIGQLFAISYILGMLVRYYPRAWMDLIYQRSSDTSDKLLPTLLHVIEQIERNFPATVMGLFEHLVSRHSDEGVV